MPQKIKAWKKRAKKKPTEGGGKKTLLLGGKVEGCVVWGPEGKKRAKKGLRAQEKVLGRGGSGGGEGEGPKSLWSHKDIGTGAGHQ